MQNASIERWSETLIATRLQIRIWRSLAILGVVALLSTGASLWIMLSDQYRVTGMVTERFVLSDRTQERIEVDAGANITPEYILASSRAVVALLESWTSETIGENYQTLFSEYTTPELQEYLQRKLRASRLLENAERHKLVSVWRMSETKSQGAYCWPIQAACALIVGTRTTYKNGNVPIGQKEVAYLIISSASLPKNDEQTLLRVERVILDDTSASPAERMNEIFSSAQKGKLPEVNHDNQD